MTLLQERVKKLDERSDLREFEDCGAWTVDLVVGLESYLAVRSLFDLTSRGLFKSSVRI